MIIQEYIGQSFQNSIDDAMKDAIAQAFRHQRPLLGDEVTLVADLISIRCVMGGLEEKDVMEVKISLSVVD